jgi:flavodoxin
MTYADIVLVCESLHHGNTRRVAEAMVSATGGRILPPGDEARESARNGALLGLGSGIYFGSHHKTLLTFAQSLPGGNAGSAFLFSTSGTGYRLPRLASIDYHRRLRRILQDKGFTLIGEFSCKGFDTYGPWGRIGGVAKGHPSDTELNHARAFARGLMHEL